MMKQSRRKKKVNRLKETRIEKVRDTAETPVIDEDHSTAKDPTPDNGEAIKQGRINKEIKKRITIAAVLLLVLIASAIIYFVVNKKPKISIAISQVTEGSTLLIFGDNLPKDSSNVEVYFNELRAGIIQYSPTNLEVVVPTLAKETTDRNVRVALVVNKEDTAIANHTLLVKERVKFETKPLVESSNSQAVSSAQKIDSIPKIKKAKNTTPVPKDEGIVTDAPEVKNLPIEKQPEPVTTPAKKIFRIDEIAKVSNDFKRRTLGGVKNIKIVVENISKYDLDKVDVQVSYLRDDREVKSETITFTNILAHSSKALDGPNANKAKNVATKIVSIQSSQLEKDGSFN